MTEPGLAVVTGITGFIGQHVAAALLNQGWKVRGTLRDPRRADEAREAVASIAPAATRNLSFAVAELGSDDGWDTAVKDAQAVCHVASPIPMSQPKDRDALVGPARDGALRVLAAADRSGSVRKVVMTSSVAAICDGHGPNVGKVFDEADWSDPEGPGISPYARSKTLAERAAWGFMADGQRGFSLTVINPGLVLGPVLGKDYGISPEVVRRLLAGEVPGTPRLGWLVVDVRDVADLHVKALLSPAGDGKRFVCASDFLWLADMASALRSQAPEISAKVPRNSVPDLVLHAMGLFDPAVRSVARELGRRVDASNALAREVFAWHPRSGSDAVLATARSMVAHGIV